MTDGNRLSLSRLSVVAKDVLQLNDLSTVGFFVFRLGHTLGEWQILLLPAFVYLHLLGCGWNWPIKASHPFQHGGLLLPKRGQRAKPIATQEPLLWPCCEGSSFPVYILEPPPILRRRKPSEEDREEVGIQTVLSRADTEL